MDPVFHWFGGKRRIASEVWRLLGTVNRYIEPFSGSAAVLFARKTPFEGQELLNDSDGLLVNFYRSIRADLPAVLDYLQHPVAELDLIARKCFLVDHAPGIVDRLRADPYYHHSEIAAWWYYGHLSSVGNRFLRAEERPNRFLPAMMNHSVAEQAQNLRAAAERLVHTTLVCGEWERTVQSDKVLFNGSSTVGIFFDPPYGADRTQHIYHNDNPDTADKVREWCLDHGHDPRLRIVLAGYEEEHQELESHGWRTLRWTAMGGHGNRRSTGDNANRYRETIWASPHCLAPIHQFSLFDDEPEPVPANFLSPPTGADTEPTESFLEEFFYEDVL